MSGLERLRRQWPLGSQWKEPEAFLDEVSAAGTHIARVGILSRHSDDYEVVGGAASVGPPPAERAYFELLERASITEAVAKDQKLPWVDRDTGATVGEVDGVSLFPSSSEPQRWAYSKSNGVAFHTSLEEACDRALWELIERDRILRAWYGQLALERTDLPAGGGLDALQGDYSLEAYFVPGRDPRGFGSEVRVAAIFGFPSRPGVPLIRGFGARPRAADALCAAAREVLQALAFTWEEELPTCPGDVAPTAQAHLDWYLFEDHHPVLRRWLDVGHGRYAMDWPHPPMEGPPAYVDLTPSWLQGRAWVVKAVAPHAVPLTFGGGPDALSGHLPRDARVHPIA